MARQSIKRNGTSIYHIMLRGAGGLQISTLTHNESEGNGARRRILEYEDDRSKKYREDLQTDNKHKRP